MVPDIMAWMKTYLYQRDLATKAIVSIEEKGDSLFVEYIGKKQLFIIHPHFEDKQHLLLQLNSREHQITIVALNTKKNFEQLINWWDFLVQYPMLTLFFVAPPKNEKWVIAPFTHAKIADPETLEKGLRGLAEQVGFIE